MTATSTQIVIAADQLFHQHGVEHTSFADIAQAVGISRGNFYHHFKSKDDILDAVIALRLANTQTMLRAWEQSTDGPAQRIRCFIGMLIANQDQIMQYGCPVGTLCAELAKLRHVAQNDAERLFMLFREWLVRQFQHLGQAEQADDLAMHLLMRSQGVAALANAFRDPAFIEREVKNMHVWLDQHLPAD
jgi:AcrR family transcriptional regulator